jgi:hypothetical protein
MKYVCLYSLTQSVCLVEIHSDPLEIKEHFIFPIGIIGRHPVEYLHQSCNTQIYICMHNLILYPDHAQV